MRRPILLYWSWVFLGLSIVAITLALTDLAGSTGIAYVLFILFFMAYLGSLFWSRRKPPPLT